MFSAVRRFGVASVLRTSVPRTLSARWAPQLLKWQPKSAASPALVRSFQTSFPAFSEATATRTAEEGVESAVPEFITEFEDLKTQGLIDPTIIRNIVDSKRMGLKTMTDIQSHTINQALNGEDILAQAKTGTGKTLAFLVPTMQNILNDPTVTKSLGNSRRSSANASDIRAIIISPTRELAEQIAEEARKIASSTGLVVQTAVGGTHKRSHLRNIQNEGCHLLVGTPGRIQDIFSDPSSGVSAPRLNTLILDEADRLLDAGFSQEIAQIQKLLPDPHKVERQTLLFSATVPSEVMRVVKQTMKKDFKFIKTVQENEIPTHLRVPQKIVVMNGYENCLPSVIQIAQDYNVRRAEDPSLRPFKAIVYFNCTSEVQLASELFMQLPRDRGHTLLGSMKFYQIHSRLTQRGRTWAADTFRACKEGILFSSDVTARGMDFPEVTHVIQLGVTRDRETYIHRLGRTGRANKEGEGWLLIHEDEFQNAQRKYRDLPLQEADLAAATQDMSQDVSAAPEAAKEAIEAVKSTMAELPTNVREATYRSMLGTLTMSFYSKRVAIEALNNFALHGMCLPEPPIVSRNIAMNLGLSRYSELRTGHVPREDSGSLRSGSSPSRDFRRATPSGDRQSFGGRRGGSSFGGNRERTPFGGRDNGPRRTFSRDGQRGDRGGFGRGDRGERSFRPRQSHFDFGSE
ncbi:ATP-dependent RNA helicase [Penicillium taxi]|uniref:ATP-dependent RNA helicase n=1 Tax=Penicillium taxi TaxID=168475 RepID=UPI002544FE5C|nr:ATP-dependent RNA helicase [Penicillium taxi]KAJ5901648.1 ATP-dependent RNA helicase [Penicillium taxi]